MLHAFLSPAEHDIDVNFLLSTNTEFMENSLKNEREIRLKISQNALNIIYKKSINNILKRTFLKVCNIAIPPNKKLFLRSRYRQVVALTALNVAHMTSQCFEAKPEVALIVFQTGANGQISILNISEISGSIFIIIFLFLLD